MSIRVFLLAKWKTTWHPHEYYGYMIFGKAY